MHGSLGLAFLAPCFTSTVSVSLVKGLIAPCLSFPIGKVEIGMVYTKASSTGPGPWEGLDT